MIRHGIKLLLLTLLVLSQTACPKYAPKQPEEMGLNSSRPLSDHG